MYIVVKYLRNHSDRVRFSPGVAGGASLFINSTTELTVAYTCACIQRNRDEVAYGNGMVRSGRVWYRLASSSLTVGASLKVANAVRA